MKIKLNCLWLHHNQEKNALSCNANNGQGCYKKHCPLSEINNYLHLCKDCWKLKGVNCPNHGLCSSVIGRPHFETLQHAIDTGKVRI